MSCAKGWLLTVVAWRRGDVQIALQYESQMGPRALKCHTRVYPIQGGL